MDKKNEILIVVNENIPLATMRGEVSLAKLDANKLIANIRGFIQALEDLPKELASLPKSMQVDEIEFSLAVGAEGQVGLLGTGVSASVDAGITVHVKLTPK